MISFKVSEPNDQAYQDYCLMYQRAKGQPKGRLRKEIFINKLRKNVTIKLENSEFTLDNNKRYEA